MNNAGPLACDGERRYAVLIGYTERRPESKAARVQLLDTRDFGRRDGKIKSSTDDAVFDGLGYFGDLDPAEPFDSAYAPAFKTILLT